MIIDLSKDDICWCSCMVYSMDDSWMDWLDILSIVIICMMIDVSIYDDNRFLVGCNPVHLSVVGEHHENFTMQ